MSPNRTLKTPANTLRAKWDPNNSAPGTVVMPIMFHRITDEVNQVYQISEAYLDLLLRDLHKMGFETISMQQLAGFLQRNEKIPARSVLLIVDDLHTEAYYRTFFEPYFKEFGWTSVTNAWISEPEASKRVLEGNRLLQDEGWVDHQAHGVIHNVNIYEAKPGTYITTPLYGTVSADEYAYNELNGAYEAITECIWKGAHCLHLARRKLLQARGRNRSRSRLPAWFHGQPARPPHVQLGSPGRCR